MNLVQKADACAAAFAVRWPGKIITKHAVMLTMSIGLGPEGALGDAPDLPGNWGSTQIPGSRLTDEQKATFATLTADEKRRLTAGDAALRARLKLADNEQIHGDYNVKKNEHYEAKFWRELHADGTPNDVAAAGHLLDDLERLRGIHDLDTVPPAGLAAEMYDQGYFGGFTTDRTKAIATYANALGHAWDTLSRELATWSPPGPKRPPQPDPIVVDDEAIRDEVEQLAEPYAGVGYAPATRAKYLDLIAPEPIEGAQLRDLIGHMWSCALTILGFLRLLGLKDAVLWARYVVSMAMANLQTVFFAHGAWTVPDAYRAPNHGDFTMVDGGYHVLTVVQVFPWTGGSKGQYRRVKTIEGGNVDKSGNKCILAGDRILWLGVDGRCYFGDENGKQTHSIYGWGDCTKLGIVPPPKVEPKPAPEPAPAPLPPPAPAPLVTPTPTWQHLVALAGSAASAVAVWTREHPVAVALGVVVLAGVVAWLVVRHARQAAR